MIRSKNDADTSEKYIGIVNDLSKELLEEILAQRVMVFAEQGDLVPTIEPIITLDILTDSVNYLSHHKFSKDRLVQKEEAEGLELIQLIY